MQKSWLSILAGLISMNFTSAYNGYSSLSNFFYWIEPSTMILAVLFLVFFAFLYYVLSKIFRNEYHQPNKAVAGVIALCMSLLIVYGINRSAWDIEAFFYRFNISNILIYIVSIAAIIFLLWLIFRKKRKKDWEKEYYKKLTKRFKKRRR